ncbi:MAG: potassium channel protein [Thermoplasmata archaeon]
MAGVRRRFILRILGRIWKFLAAFGGVYVASAVAFFYAEMPHLTLFNSFYWGIVTISTAGYGDIVPTNPTAKVVAMATLFTQIFLLAYLISVIASTVTDEAERRALGTLGTDMKGHIVVVGYTGVGQAAVRELLIQDQTVAVITERPEDVAHIRSLAPDRRLFATYGPPAETTMLERVNVAQAHSVIICTSDDATNMIATLNVRSLAPEVRVVVAVSRPELRTTLQTAGVTYVASPSDLGGRMCAAAAFEPDVANALEDVTAADVRSDMQEYVLRASGPLSGTSFGESEKVVRASTGCLLVGYARPNAAGDFETLLAPPETDRLAAGDAVLIIGTIANTKRFRTWFGVDQGR